ncbi:MAG TPA: hypothetical protein VN207_03775, partial [Ktedonobacteraceae bacterium]|nr:hypothetical protein [Ktedonobacteraceae bacterium]
MSEPSLLQAPSSNDDDQAPRQIHPHRFIILVVLALLLFIGIPIILFLSTQHIIPEFWATIISVFLGTWGFYAGVVSLLQLTPSGAVSRVWQKALYKQPTIPPSPPSAVPLKRMRKTTLISVILVVLFLVLGVPFTGWYRFIFPHNPCTTIWTSFFPAHNNINIRVEPDGTCIGLSDGLFAFDWNLNDRPANYVAEKSQMMDKLRAGDLQGARQLWQNDNVTNDAEMQIYLQDQGISESNAPHITLVLAVTLSGSYPGGRDILQGAAAIQNKYNQSCKLPDCTKLRLIVANTGKDSSDATKIAQQIAQAAAEDKTIVGVVGWPLSQYSIDAVSILSSKHIPMVSPTA